jgi:serine O-acetyltransferase
MSLKTLVDTLRADIERHWFSEESWLKNVHRLIMTQGVWATVVYRYGQWTYEDHPTVIRIPAKMIYHTLNKWTEMATGIQLPASAKIGKGFYIGHFGTIIIHTHTVMGERCGVGQGVTIGTRGSGDKGTPVIGNDVTIHAGAKVLGGIRIGNNVNIGANAVVSHDVADNSFAIARPGRVYPKDPG